MIFIAKSGGDGFEVFSSRKRLFLCVLLQDGERRGKDISWALSRKGLGFGVFIVGQQELKCAPYLYCYRSRKEINFSLILHTTQKLLFSKKTKAKGGKI